MLLFQHPDFSCKDACMAWDGGRWHLFFSVFDEERSRVARVSSPDLKGFSNLEILFDGREQGWIGMCSPDLTRGPDGWVLVCNSWGMAPGRPNALHVATSSDLINWSSLRPLADELCPHDGVIDGALAWTGAVWILACKRCRQLLIATAAALDGPWCRIADVPPVLLDAETRTDNGYRHENFQLLHLGGVWHLLSTDYIPGQLHHHPWLYRMEGDPADPQSWGRWIDGRRLHIPAESWNRLDPDNAAALWDHRRVDGRFYLIYGGKDEQRLHDFNGRAATERPWPRGWNRLGLATSTDLQGWSIR